MSDAFPIYVAAAAALAWVAYVVLREQPAPSGGGDITTDSPDEGGWADWEAVASQMQAAVTFSSGGPDRMSEDGLQALMSREGFSSTPYPDHKGFSIGYGHLIKPGEFLEYVTAEQGAELLASDVEWAEDAVRSAITAQLDQNQFDALVSFAFNVGAGAFKRSTLVRRINAGDPLASSEFGRWVYASGVVNNGLVSRRAAERAQFES